MLQNLDKVKELIEYDKENPDKIISREEYKYICSHKSKYPDWYIGHIGFLMSFSTKFFAGYAGYTYKSKRHKIRNSYIEHCNSIYKQIPLLQDIKFIYQDYQEVKAENCVLYCDPPYANYKTSDIYNKNFNTEQFFDWCREQSKYNHVFVSESVLPDDFKIVWKDETAKAGLALTPKKKKIELLGYMCNM